MKKTKVQRRSRHQMWKELRQFLKAVILYEEQGILTRPAEDKESLHYGHEKYVFSWFPSPKVSPNKETTHRSRNFREILWRMSDIDGSYRATAEMLKELDKKESDECLVD